MLWPNACLWWHEKFFMHVLSSFSSLRSFPVLPRYKQLLLLYSSYLVFYQQLLKVVFECFKRSSAFYMIPKIFTLLYTALTIFLRFSSQFSYSMSRPVFQEKINRAVVFVTQNIINAANIINPKSSGHPRRHCRPWWNEECQLAKKREQKAWSIFWRYPTTTNYIIYKQVRANPRKIWRKSQKEFCINYVSSISSNTSSKQLWHHVKKAMGIYPNNGISFLKGNGQTVTPTRSIANAIGRTLANISKSDSYSEPFLACKCRKHILQ